MINKKKNVAIIAPIHKWDDIRVFKKEALSLSKNGYNIKVYAKNRPEYDIEGIEVFDINKNTRGAISRIKLQWRMLKAINESDCDLYHFHNPDTILVALFAKLYLRKKVIYDTHEDFSKRILMRDWIPKIIQWPLAKIIEKIEYMSCSILDKVIVTQEQLHLKYKEKTLILLNPPIIDATSYELNQEFSKQLNLSDSLKFIYIGGISKTRGIEEFISSYGKLCENNPDEEYEFILIGPTNPDYLVELQNNNYWHRVNYLGELPQEEAFGYLMKSDIGVCTILDVGDHKDTSANKLYEYQRFAKPFIATNFPKWVEELREVKSGVFVDPLNQKGLYEALELLSNNQELRKELGNNGLNYIVKSFNWDLEQEKLLALYKEILK